MELPFPKDDGMRKAVNRPISPMQEMVAYEALWRDRKMSFRNMAKLFAHQPGKLPSDLVTAADIAGLYDEVKAVALNPALGYRTNVLINGTFDYPSRLREAEEPLEMLYYSGNLDWLSTRSVAVVGTRKPSERGLSDAAELARFLVGKGFTVVSGLAAGIDTMAHQATIAAGGRTIAVIGTPLDQAYPAANAELQKKIAREHLLVSQVPFIRYREQGIRGNKHFFPERNKTMSVLAEATVIVEAGEGSGTLIQGRAALAQGRKLFVLDACYQNPALSWPAQMEAKGAVRVRNFKEITDHLQEP